MKAIETTGRIEKTGFLKLDGLFNIPKKQKVRVIILFNEDDEIDDKLWLASVSNNPAFEFLNDKAEDIYSINDGKPIKK